MDLVNTCGHYSGLLDNILSRLHQVIVISDIEGRVLLANQAVEELFGFNPSEFEGQNLSIIFTPEDLRFLFPNILHLGCNQEQFEGEVVLKRKDNTHFFAFISVKASKDPFREGMVLVFIIQDIDKQKRLEKAFQEANYEDLIKIANGIAHELRNPLVGIGGFVNRLYKSCQTTNDDEASYAFIINNLRKIEGLVKKVESLVSLPKPYFTMESINHLIDRTVKDFREELSERRITFANYMDEMTVLVDRDLLVRAVSILINNSIEVVSAGGRIMIHGTVKDNHCEINVTDTGAGISSHDLPYIFNPFFTTKPDGIGIDLAMVKRIMGYHGGRVRVRSTEGEGSTFSLIFPLERRRKIRISSLEAEEGNQPTVVS